MENVTKLNNSFNANAVRSANTDNEIYFNFSYAALKLLGKNLYSNAANAISELVANGLDAKATEVFVYIDMSDKAHSVIEILDNGVGMSYSDLAEKYVWIGRNKRHDNELSPVEKQTIMGRKGIGKLAALFLSNRYYIVTKQNGADQNQWEINLSGYDDSAFPRMDRMKTHVDLVNSKIWESFNHGTVVKLENVDLRGNGEKRIEALRRVFSDFYLVDALTSVIYVAVKTSAEVPAAFLPVEKSIAYKNFYAVFDNSGLNIAEKMADSIAFTWASKYPHIANEPRSTIVLEPSAFKTSGNAKFAKDDGSFVEKEYRLTGWIAVHSTIEEKNSPDKNFVRNNIYQPNRLRLYVRNKLAVADFFEISKSTQTMANYIEGEISFDILDDDELPDIATSSRQDFLSDSRIELLTSLVTPILSNLFKLRNEIGQTIREENDAYDDFLLKQEEEKRKAEEAARAEAESAARKAEEAKKEAEEKQHQAEAVAQRERRRSQYILNVSDVEDKNVLNSIHSIYNMSNRVKENLDALNNCNDFPVAGRKNLEKASTSNQRILSMSKLISKAGRIIDDNDAAKIVELSGFLSEYVTNVLSCIYDEHDIVIKCIGDLDSDFTLKIKPLSFIMLVDNLVGNAIKANATILDIIIDDSAPNVYSVVFKDNGSGISKDISDVKRLFEFGVTTTNGSGLGLFYAKKHITELKGFISIRENEEQGVSVTLSWKK